MMLPRHAEIWLPGFVRSMRLARREARQRRGVVDILFAIADHYEPLHGGAAHDVGRRRVETWLERYPAMAEPFVDADGRHPRHTFFFPIEQYRPEFIAPLASLCQQGFGEVEVHLHHDGDSAAHLRDELDAFTRTLHDRHGLLSRDGAGVIRYGFIHGNWALSNSLPDGRWCGVDDELSVLRDTGCYGDMTNPAAPSPAQTRTVNQVYYAAGARRGPRAHDRGVRAAVGRPASPEDLLLVQGPLMASFRQAKWGVVPRVENGELNAGSPPTAERFADWLSCGISVEGRPEWVFVKVHTHGAPECEAAMMLGPGAEAFHRDVLATYSDGRRYRLHYVTAREMVNIIHAAEDGKTGNPGQYRDYRFGRPPVSGTAARATE
ncbi:MAG: hypothetical protein NTY02_07485 [Acidobacteria bacterium]|nr:hypothetical protein [Acidobacteriota bacterium]